MTDATAKNLITLAVLSAGMFAGFGAGVNWMANEVHRKTKRADRILADKAADEGKPWYQRGLAPYKRIYAKLTGTTLVQPVVAVPVPALPVTAETTTENV